MRPSRLVTQLLFLIGLFYLNYFIYFNRHLIFPRELPASFDINVVQSSTYGDEFCVAFNVTKSQRTFREDGLEPVTLAVHATSTYLNYVVQHVAKWDGPISLALFVDLDSQKAVEFLYNAFVCDEIFAQKLSLHVVFRLSPFSDHCPSFELHPRPCENFTYKYMNNFLNKLLPPFAIYPINTMRNVARLGSPSHYHILSDVEMIFSEDFAFSAKKLANENLCEKCDALIVVRRFELDEKIKKAPKTTWLLREHIDNRTAFEYHHKLFPAGHTIPGLWTWFRLSNATEEPSVWEIPYKGPAWEPQLIMHSSAPLSEENVATRFRDQQALVYELCRANFTFLLASHLFNVHRGVKEEASALDNAVRNHQSKLRYRYLNWYMKRINSSYNSSRKCGKFVM